jgi:hypothetical protein
MIESLLNKMSDDEESQITLGLRVIYNLLSAFE